MNKYELKRILLDFFFPNRCPVCNKVIGRMDYICNDCADKFQYSNKEEALCGGRLISVCRYSGSAEHIVLGAKRNRDGSKLSFMGVHAYAKDHGKLRHIARCSSPCADIPQR